MDGRKLFGELVLPSSNAAEWSFVETVLGAPLRDVADLDAVLSQFAPTQSPCTFFATVPGSAEAGEFDFAAFFRTGLPLMVRVALEMPLLFQNVQVPIFKMRSSWAGPRTLGRQSFSLTRRQCACLLAHSFFGSLKRPPSEQPNDFRFTVKDPFMGTAASPNSATTFLNYWNVLGTTGIQDDVLAFERLGYLKGPSPWQWEQNGKPLCRVELVDGSIDDCAAEVHVEFANAFIGGGVMTGDAAQEETLFLVKPELMVAHSHTHDTTPHQTTPRTTRTHLHTHDRTRTPR
jgi:poly(ADP-ribose) glycohydrolase